MPMIPGNAARTAENVLRREIDRLQDRRDRLLARRNPTRAHRLDSQIADLSAVADACAIASDEWVAAIAARIGGDA